MVMVRLGGLSNETTNLIQQPPEIAITQRQPCTALLQTSIPPIIHPRHTVLKIIRICESQLQFARLAVLGRRDAGPVLRRVLVKGDGDGAAVVGVNTVDRALGAACANVEYSGPLNWVRWVSQERGGGGEGEEEAEDGEDCGVHVGRWGWGFGEVSEIEQGLN